MVAPCPSGSRRASPLPSRTPRCRRIRVPLHPTGATLPTRPCAPRAIPMVRLWRGGRSLWRSLGVTFVARSLLHLGAPAAPVHTPWHCALRMPLALCPRVAQAAQSASLRQPCIVHRVATGEVCTKACARHVPGRARLGPAPTHQWLLVGQGTRSCSICSKRRDSPVALYRTPRSRLNRRRRPAHQHYGLKPRRELHVQPRRRASHLASPTTTLVHRAGDCEKAAGSSS